MTNEELKTTAFRLLAIAKSLELHQVSANAVYSLSTRDTEIFNYHAKEYIRIIFDTLKDESDFIREIVDRLLEAEEEATR